MKRFIVISLLAAATLPSLACAWLDTGNYYLFSPYDVTEFRERTYDTMMNNWKTYLGKTGEYHWFDADEAIKIARGKGDKLMVGYIQQLNRYLDCAEQKRQEQWDYPTKQQLEQRRQTLLAVRTYAQGKLQTRLRSQHALLFMRCNMMLGRHQENVQFWKQTASKYIESVYRDMMQNIYAGALFRTGQDAEAGRVFAEQGDWESLMTQYYKRRSCAAIRQEYQRDPASPVLPFLLKDFVNNAQEAFDVKEEGSVDGKLFVRKIQRQEALQMCELAKQAVREGKTPVPAMWQNAKAWLEYMLGNKKQGVADILAAAKMEGTERIKDNTRILTFYMTAADRQDDYIAGELQWLTSKEQYGNFYYMALQRTMRQVLEPRYAKRPVELMALLNIVRDYEFLCYMDTTKVETLQRYIDYARTPAKTALDRFLKSRQRVPSQHALSDLLGTKHLRLCQWDEAVKWLSQVPLSYYNDKGYAVYACHRRYDVEPWMKRQWLKEGLEYSDQKWQLKSNPKIDFAREMKQLEGKQQVLTGRALSQCYFDQAVRLAQAHFTGDCWFLMRDGKSAGDELRVNETDLAARAVSLLRKASQTSDFSLKERSLFALSYVHLHPTPWYSLEWDSSRADTYRVPQPQSSQYKAFAALTVLEKQNATHTSSYVSRCDEYKQFRKWNK